MTLHINFYAGPGVGKTVTAAALFVALSLQGVHAELVREYAKELTYKGTIHLVSQKEIFAEQYARQSLFHGHAQVVITDSPVPLTLIYGSEEDFHDAHEKIRELTGDWESLNFLLHRDLDSGYQTAGRYQNIDQAKSLHHDVVVPFCRSYHTDDLIEHNVLDGVDGLAKLIIARLNTASRAKKPAHL